MILILSLSGCRIGNAHRTTVDSSQDRPVATTSTISAPSTEKTGEPDYGPVGGVAGDTLPLAARVNGQPIFLYTYERQVAQLEQALQAQEIERPADLNRQVLDGLIEQAVIEQQAHRLGLTVSDQVLDAKIQEEIREKGPNQFEAWLAANRLTYQTFKQTVRSQLVTNRVFEHVTGEVPHTAEQVQVWYILAPDEATAWKLIDRLKAGVDFKTIAREQLSSTDGESSWFPRQLSPLPESVTAMAFSLQPGEINGPIGTPQGFYIIKLEKKEVERPLTTEMFRALQKKIFTDWLLEQRSAAVVERLVTF